MKKHLILSSVAACLLLFSPTFSGDLYLLGIGDQSQLDIARAIVDHANGTIGGKFLIDINEEQRSRLEAGGLTPELVSADFIPDRFFIVSRVSRQLPKAAITFESRLSYDNAHLVELVAGEDQILKKDGYTIIRVADLKTPLFYHPPVVPAPFSQYYPLDTLVNLISQDSLYAYDTRLEAFRTRYVTTDSILQAGDYILDKFREFGYSDAYLEPFTYYYTDCFNVVCVKQGSTEPDKIIVVGGHYDSYNGQTAPEIFAPGADDNASGTATVLELARILRNVDLKKSVMFVAFSAEEVGLVGSYISAYNLSQLQADVECMLNFDMVAYTMDDWDNVVLYSGANSTYTNVMINAADRVTDLYCSYQGYATNSDHASFDQFGYLTAFAIEGDFNTEGWHTNLDISSRLDFPFCEKVARMAVATIGQIDVAGQPSPIQDIFDAGDGHTLRIIWGNCQSSYQYKILYGTYGQLTDTADVPQDSCSYDLTGLITGNEYSIAVFGITPEGYGPLYLILGYGTPYVIPRAPSSIMAEPGDHEVVIIWDANRELDMDHYRVLRRLLGGDWTVLADNVLVPEFHDQMAAPLTKYEYAAIAIDNDQNESDTSAVVWGIPASFDKGCLFVDETDKNGITPGQEAQMAFYDSLMVDLPHDTMTIGSATKPPDRIDRFKAGQYGSIIWLDDDVAVHRFNNSEDTLAWYTKFHTNLCLAGWETFYYAGGVPTQLPGDFFYDDFGITEIDMNEQPDFISALGHNGWPDLQVKPTSYGGQLNGITVFDTLPGVEVIYTYNSFGGSGDYQGKPVGVIYTDSAGGRRVALGFPIFHLMEPGAQLLMSKIFGLFGIEPVSHYGDADNNNVVNIMDVAYLIGYLYFGRPAPVDTVNADPDGSCDINILDVAYIISYLYKGGPPPVAGCAK